jgi:DNA-binding NarL/FixJ family response regulator
MRVVLVGAAADRARLRDELTEAGVSVVAEADTLESARDAARDADAVVVASRGLAGAAEPPGLFLEPLTPRELDVLHLLALGLPNKAIAARLGISDQTVKFHVASILGKLGAANRTDAVRRAARRGIIDL